MIENCTFATTGRNPFFILEPGFELILEGEDDGEEISVTITVLDETFVVDGVECRVVEEYETEDGEWKHSYDDQIDWDVAHGTQVAIELEARYQRGRRSVDDYLQQTAIANPHVGFVYHAPDGRAEIYEASIKELLPVPIDDNN